MSIIDEIKSKVDIVELASEAGVKLRHAGRNYTGFCPFHENKHTPSFVIWPDSGTWRCFGQCNEGGDVFKFVMKRENIDFKAYWEDMGKWSFGHPAIRKLTDGCLLLAYYAGTPDAMSIHWARVEI